MHDFEKDATFSVLEKTTKSQLLARESQHTGDSTPPWTQPEIWAKLPTAINDPSITL